MSLNYLYPDSSMTSMPELVFHIPRVPKITDIPTIKPVNRPPPPGYDMKTLRKQVEFFNLVNFDLFINLYPDLRAS